MKAGAAALRPVQKRYGSRALAAAIVVGFICIILGERAVGKGLVLGTLFSVINFVLMGEIIPYKLGKTRAKTFSFALGSVCVRYALLMIPLVLSIKLDQLNIVATVVGLFMIQLMIAGDHLFTAIGATLKRHTQGR
jgi:hypothetical protein